MLWMKSFDEKEGLAELKKRISAFKKKEGFFLVGIDGGSGAGKTFLAKKLGEKTIPLDDYFKGKKFVKNNNWDAPGIMDISLAKFHLRALKKGKKVLKPVYSFRKCARIGAEDFAPAKILVVEGIHALNKKLVPLYGLKVFLECSEKKRLQRRIKRDIKERDYKKETVQEMWKSSVQPMYLKHIAPTKKYSDIVIRT